MSSCFCEDKQVVDTTFTNTSVPKLNSCKNVNIMVNSQSVVK